MSYLHIEEEAGADVRVPKPALFGALTLALLVIVGAGAARHAQAHAAPSASLIRPVAARTLVFSDEPDGSIGVYDPVQRVALAPLPEGGGFVRGALRALARQRRLGAIGHEVPFYLARWPDGRLTLDDSATRTHLELRAYGTTNEAAFVRLLPDAP